jgi:hypothetical protein
LKLEELLRELDEDREDRWDGALVMAIALARV